MEKPSDRDQAVNEKGKGHISMKKKRASIIQLAIDLFTDL